MTIRVGTDSWTDKTLIDCGRFYPKEAKTAEARLRFYASIFPMVEVDASYYAIPAPATAQLWAERTPDAFVFTALARMAHGGIRHMPVIDPVTGHAIGMVTAGAVLKLRAQGALVLAEDIGAAKNAADLGAILKRVAEALEIQARNKRMHVVVDFPIDLPPVNGQDDELSQIFQNLIDNAIKYGRKAHISIGATPYRISITIADEGPGIPESRMQDVFKPFMRVENSRSRKTGGSGLGLTIARSLIQKMGGEITLSNAPGGGLSAKLSLPRSESDRQHALLRSDPGTRAG